MSSVTTSSVATRGRAPATVPTIPTGARGGVPVGLDSWEPDAGLAEVLAGIDVDRISPHDRVTVLRAAQRMVSHYQALLYGAMVAVRDAYRAEDPDVPDEECRDGAATEIAAALHLTRAAAREELSTAEVLTADLPRLGEALAAGRLDLRRCRVAIEETWHLSGEVARRVVDRVAEEAETLTTGQLRARLRRLCLEADADGEAERIRETVEGRRLYTGPSTGGAADLLVLDVPPEAAQAASDRVDRLARRLGLVPGETRTLDQLRADVALDLLCHGETPRTADARIRPILELHVDLATLAGLDDRPAELAGWGPVAADLARRVAADASRIGYTVTHPDSGEIIHTGSTRRRPTTDQTRLVRARQPRCVFPGCRMPAFRCDLDHRTPYADGGATCECNLYPLCRFHHRIRHRHGWRYTPAPRWDLTWTSPLGHTYRTSPTRDRHPPDPSASGPLPGLNPAVVRE